MTAPSEVGRRVVAGGWLLPHFAHRRLAPEPGETLVSLGDVAFPENDDPRWTVVGAVGSAGRAAVDSRGLVTPEPGGWSLDWWIGADDRWHLPSQESAVTQELVEGSGVVETAVRIPSGVAVQRVYGLAGSPDLVVVEIENASPAPLALALAVRPFDQLGVTGVRRVEADGTLVQVDGREAMVLARPPRRVAGSRLAEGDCVASVTAGEAEEGPALAVDDPDGMATAAFVFPLAHRTTVRVALALPHDGGIPPAVDVASLPDSADAARAWAAHLGRGMTVVLPDEQSQRAVDAARAHLALLDDGRSIAPVPWGTGTAGSDDVTMVLAALERWGFGRQAAEVAPLLWRRRRRRRPHHLSGTEAWARAAALLDAASPTYTWAGGGAGAHGRPVADFLLAVRDGLVGVAAGGVVEVLPALPGSWRGQNVELRDAPVRGGRLSYAVRWHGDRPALLWEHDAGGVTLRAPGLDPSWETAEPSGEALLRGHAR